MKHAKSVLGFLSAPLPRASKKREIFDCFSVSHPVTIIFNSNLFNGPKVTLNHNDIDFTRLGVNGVPDELDDPRNGITLEKTL